jgi:hypothetical protein
MAENELVELALKQFQADAKQKAVNVISSLLWDIIRLEKERDDIQGKIDSLKLSLKNVKADKVIL